MWFPTKKHNRTKSSQQIGVLDTLCSLKDDDWVKIFTFLIEALVTVLPTRFLCCLKIQCRIVCLCNSMWCLNATGTHIRDERHAVVLVILLHLALITLKSSPLTPHSQFSAYRMQHFAPQKCIHNNRIIIWKSSLFPGISLATRRLCSHCKCQSRFCFFSRSCLLM